MNSSATNPLLISAINMVIVFGVLTVLGFVMVGIRLIDPTQKKKIEPKPEAAKIARPAAKAVAAPAPAPKDGELIAVLAAALEAYNGSGENIAVIAAALAAYTGSKVDVAHLKIKGSKTWTINARAEAVNVGRECF